MIDLSGVTPSPSAAMLARFRRCLGAAAADRRLWTEPAKWGDEVLREQLAIRLGRPAGQIAVTSGVRATALFYGKRFRTILLEQPSYDGVATALAESGASVQRHSWPLLASQARPGDLVWVTSPHRNPDGACLSTEELESFVASTVVVNLTYGWWTKAVPRGVDLVGGLHKIMGLGARIGFMVGDTALTAAVDLAAWAPSAVWQRAWGLLLADGSFDDEAEQVYTDAGRAAQAFAEHEPSGSPHFLVSCGSRSETQWVSQARAVGVKVSPGSAFGASGHVRLSLLGVPVADAVVAARRLRDAGLTQPREVHCG
jgi:DNA-binding transcriptional MocR family regulator